MPLRADKQAGKVCIDAGVLGAQLLPGDWPPRPRRPDAHPIVEALSDSRYQRRAAFGVVPCHKILRVGHGSGTFATIGCAFCCTAESPGNFAPSTTVRPTTTLCYAEPDSLSIAS
jgi:hypothetical protein